MTGILRRIAIAAASSDACTASLKRLVAAVGLGGFLTSAAETGASAFKMMEVSRHRSMDTLNGYVRRSDLFRDHAGTPFL